MRESTSMYGYFNISNIGKVLLYLCTYKLMGQGT